ncbi:MAG: alpha/beta fold hydrolase [Steroidobacteraceae bacterium]
MRESAGWAWRRPSWLLCLSGTFAAAVLAFGSALFYLKLHENELVFRTAISHTRTTGQLPPGAESLVIQGAGGSELAALILRPDAAHDSAFWILHLHGNADSAFSSEQLRHCESLRELGFSVLSFDYRGFGMSAGDASEVHMEQDAEAAFDALIERGISPAHIILWGHSLGSGPAVLLASEHSVAALVLFGAFTSIPDAAQDTYPYLPVRWIAGIRFASIDLIARVHVPVLIAHSATDTLIPFHHAQRLFAAANEPKRLLVLDGVYSDGFGGHVSALYDHGELLVPALSALIGQQLSLAGTTPPPRTSE